MFVQLGSLLWLGARFSYVLTAGCSLVKDNLSSSPLHPIQPSKQTFLQVISYPTQLAAGKQQIISQ